MNSCELVNLISALSCAIAKSFTPDETALLAVFFTQLGDSLATIDVANSFFAKENQSNAAQSAPKA